MRYQVGLDWGAAAHAVCVVDETRGVVDQFAIEHTAEGIADMLARSVLDTGDGRLRRSPAKRR
jgi:hypothetical protein